MEEVFLLVICLLFLPRQRNCGYSGKYRMTGAKPGILSLCYNDGDFNGKYGGRLASSDSTSLMVTTTFIFCYPLQSKTYLTCTWYDGNGIFGSARLDSKKGGELTGFVHVLGDCDSYNNKQSKSNCLDYSSPWNGKKIGSTTPSDCVAHEIGEVSTNSIWKRIGSNETFHFCISTTLFALAHYDGHGVFRRQFYGKSGPYYSLSGNWFEFGTKPLKYGGMLLARTPGQTSKQATIFIFSGTENKVVDTIPIYYVWSHWQRTPQCEDPRSRLSGQWRDVESTTPNDDDFSSMSVDRQFSAKTLSSNYPINVLVGKTNNAYSCAHGRVYRGSFENHDKELSGTFRMCVTEPKFANVTYYRNDGSFRDSIKLKNVAYCPWMLAGVKPLVGEEDSKDSLTTLAGNWDGCSGVSSRNEKSPFSICNGNPPLGTHNDRLSIGNGTGIYASYGGSSNDASGYYGYLEGKYFSKDRVAVASYIQYYYNNDHHSYRYQQPLKINGIMIFSRYWNGQLDILQAAPQNYLEQKMKRKWNGNAMRRILEKYQKNNENDCWESCVRNFRYLPFSPLNNYTDIGPSKKKSGKKFHFNISAATWGIIVPSIVLGLVVLLFVIVGTVACCIQRKRTAKLKRERKKAEAENDIVAINSDEREEKRPLFSSVTSSNSSFSENKMKKKKKEEEEEKKKTSSSNGNRESVGVGSNVDGESRAPPTMYENGYQQPMNQQVKKSEVPTYQGSNAPAYYY